LKPRRFQFLGRIAPDLGVDLGTIHTRICIAGEGIVLDEPTVVAVEQRSHHGLKHAQAVGNLAKIMQGRTPESIQTKQPVRSGVVADHHAGEAMLRAFLRKARPRNWGLLPRVLVAVSGGITPVERQAVLNTVARAGARQVSLIRKSLVAALGAGLPVAQPMASMICDIGGGASEIAIVCLAEVAASESLRVAGDELDLAIIDYLRRNHRLRVGQQMAERIKIEIGTATPLDAELTMEVGGRDLMTGLPRKMTLTSDQVREALHDPVRLIVAAVQRVLESCPAEFAGDLMENGMVLTGGGAQLRGLERRLAEATGMPVRVAEDPATCVVRGLGICVEHLDVWQSLIQDRRAA
jgi:rod shape-determining protein MreB